MKTLSPLAASSSGSGFAHYLVPIRIMCRCWIMLLRESSLKGCYWELKDSRYWPKWLLTVFPVGLFMLVAGITWWGWQSLIMMQWQAASTYGLTLSEFTQSHAKRQQIHGDWTARNQAIHSLSEVLPRHIAPPSNPLEAVASHAQRNGVVMHHLVPLDQNGRHAYDILLEGHFGELMKFLFTPMDETIWNIQGWLLEPSSSSDSAHALDPVGSGGPLQMAVHLSWDDPQRLHDMPDSAINTGLTVASEPSEAPLSATTLQRGESMLDRLLHRGLKLPDANPFDAYRLNSPGDPNSLDSLNRQQAGVPEKEVREGVERGIKRKEKSASAGSGEATRSRLKLLYLGTYRDQRGIRALVVHDRGIPFLAVMGEVLPPLKLKVVRFDGNTLYLQSMSEPHAAIISLSKAGSRESFIHE